MHKLTNHIKSHQNLLLQLHCAIRSELQENQKEKKELLRRLQVLKTNRRTTEYNQLVFEQGFNEDDCREVLKDIARDIEKCNSCEFDEDERIACLGDSVIGVIFGGRRLDILVFVNSAKASVYAWVVADCKFAMKCPTYGTVCSSDNFSHDVDDKYNAVFARLKKEGEFVWRTRLILVTTEARRVIERYIKQQNLGTGHPLLGRSDYALCDVVSIGEMVKKAANQYRSATHGGRMCPAVFG